MYIKHFYQSFKTIDSQRKRTVLTYYTHTHTYTEPEIDTDADAEREMHLGCPYFHAVVVSICPQMMHVPKLSNCAHIDN